jgi:hypothetical protein
VIVVPLVVPSTRTLTPFFTAAAELELVPLRYLVEDAFLTVTFWPADVTIVKLDPDTLCTVPDDPPAAGPDRAFDPPPPGTRWAGVAAADDDAVVAVPDPLLAVALTMPYEPPARAIAVAPMARSRVGLRENMEITSLSFGGTHRA